MHRLMGKEGGVRDEGGHGRACKSEVNSPLV